MDKVKNMRKILLAILVIAAAYGVWSMATFAYFNDVEEVKDNSITAGTWISIDSSSAILTGNGMTNLHGIFLVPGEPGSDNVIDKISISWTGGEGKVTEIRMGGDMFWSGIGESGQELVGNYVVDKKTVNEYRFSSDVHDETFTISFTMSNGQVISDTFTPKWKDEKPEEQGSSLSQSSDSDGSGDSDGNDNHDVQTVTGGNTETLTSN